MKKIILLFFILFLGCSNKNEQVIYLSTIDEEPHQTTKTKKVKIHKQKVKNKNSKRKNLKPYKVLGKWYYPREAKVGEKFKGTASWYGPNFHGKLTANGETYNMYAYTAANKILPMNTRLKVTNLNNHKSVVVRVNDRGPFVEDRILDLSYIAGKKIGLDKTGIAPVEVVVLSKNYKENRKKNGKIKIQIGAFKNLSGALIFKEEFQKLGKKTYIKKVAGIYKVFIGNFKTKKEAIQFKKKNSVKGFIID